MAERKLNTRISLRYDSYANWSVSTVKLLKGEVAICYVEENNTEIKNTAPTVLFKVGDGEHVFADLKWASARAADVHDWAKAENRPVYSKADVGLGNVLNVASYSKDEINTKISEIQGALEADTNTQYQIVKVGDNGFKLQSKDIAGEWKDVEGSSFTVDFTAINNVLAGKADASSLNNYYTKGEIDGKGFLTEHQDISGKADKTDLNNYYTKEEVEGKGYLVASDIAGKADKTELNNYYVKSEVEGLVSPKADKSYVDEELGKKVNSSDYNGKVSSIEGRLDVIEGDNGIAGIKESIGDIELDIEELDGKFGGYYTKGEADSKFLTSHQDISGKADITYVDGKVETINGSIKEINDAIEALTNGTSTDEIDSVMELVDYVNEHGTEVKGMKDSIKANADAIDVLEAKPAMGISSDDITNWNGIEGRVNGELAKKVDLEGYVAYSTEEKEKLAGLENYNDSAIRGLISAEETRAKGVEEGLEGRIKAYEDVKGNYALKSELFSKNYNDLTNKPDLTVYETVENVNTVKGLINTEKGRIDTLVGTTVPGLEGRISTLEGKPFDTYATKSEVEAVDTLVDGAIERVAAIEADYLKGEDKTALSNAINTEKGRIDTLVNTTVPGIDNRVKALEAKPFDKYLMSDDVIIWDCGGAAE